MEHTAILGELLPFLNEAGRLTALPAKHRKKLLALWYLAGKLPAGETWTESQLGGLLDGWTTFHDPATLRRELYNKRLLERTENGSRYWRAESLPPLADFLARYL